MNNKQILILVITVIGIVLIVIFTPRYKIAWIDKRNFIKTEQTSSLYKRSKGKESLYWGRIALYAGTLILAASILITVSRSQHE